MTTFIGDNPRKALTYLEQENSVLHSKLRSLEMKLEKAEKALAVEKARYEAFGRWTYPHMCRNEHQQIGHSDSEHERCPLCRANDEIYDLKEALTVEREACAKVAEDLLQYADAQNDAARDRGDDLMTNYHYGQIAMAREVVKQIRDRGTP